MAHKVLFPRRNVLLALFICLAITGIFYSLRRLVPSEGRSIAEAKLAINKGDTRFVTVHGYAVSVPGIPDGTANGLVLLHGQKPPIGVGDFILNPIQDYQQDAASKYAQFYNVFLFKYLLDNPDQKTKSYLKRVRQELRHFEKGNAQSDAVRAFKSSPEFLLVAGEKDGYPLDDNRPAWIPSRLLLMNSLVVRGGDRKLFDKVMKTYLIPYNRNLYTLLKRKWEKQGVKNLIGMSAPARNSAMPT
jgi:hypothetical protein